MSYFGEFLAYVELYASGKLWKNMAYKNYDLLWKASKTRLRAALADCGYKADELEVALAECATRLRERGYAALSNSTVRQLLMEWWVWRRIEGGEYRKWKHRNQ